LAPFPGQKWLEQRADAGLFPFAALRLSACTDALIVDEPHLSGMRIVAVGT
jgi:hypothetical protein